jgi:hypothetical protein
MIRAAIGYPIFNEINIDNRRHLAKPTTADRVEAARNHLTWSMVGRVNALG